MARSRERERPFPNEGGTPQDQHELCIMHRFLTRQFLASASNSIPLFILSLREMDELGTVRSLSLCAGAVIPIAMMDLGDGCLLGSVSPRLRVVVLCSVAKRVGSGDTRHHRNATRALGKPALYLQTAPHRTTTAHYTEPNRTGPHCRSTAINTAL